MTDSSKISRRQILTVAAGAAGAVLWMDRLMGRGPLCLSLDIGQYAKTFSGMFLHA